MAGRTLMITKWYAKGIDSSLRTFPTCRQFVTDKNLLRQQIFVFRAVLGF